MSDPPTTVRYDACAAAIFAFDGSVDLVATSGQRILIDPSQLQDGRDAIAAIRRELDPELIVERPVTMRPLAARPYRPGGRIIVRNPRADR